MGRTSTRETLQRHGLHLRRNLGQNFLVEDGIADRLAEASGARAGEAVLEVGTGLGVLTRSLAARVDRVVTVEIDSGLVAALQDDGALPANVELIHADALELDLREIVAGLAQGGRPVRVVANLPYSAASPLLRRLLDLRDVLVDWSVMLQREMAVRLVAEVGTRDYSSLTVLHRLTVDVSREVELKPGCFFPAPKVASTFVRMFPLAQCPLRDGELLWVERVVRAVFNQRRKTILNGLRGGGLPLSDDRDALVLALERAGIRPGERAEQVAPEGLLALARELVGEPRAPLPSCDSVSSFPPSVGRRASMEPSEIMAVLLDLAREAELEVRSVGPEGGEAGAPPLSSAVCRVRDSFWVMLSSADPVAVQLDVMASALLEHAPEIVEDRFLPPAVRALLERA